MTRLRQKGHGSAKRGLASTFKPKDSFATKLEDNNDHALAKDVSAFLKNLNLGSGGNDASDVAEKSSHKKSELATKRAKLSSTKDPSSGGHGQYTKKPSIAASKPQKKPLKPLKKSEANYNTAPQRQTKPAPPAAPQLNEPVSKPSRVTKIAVNANSPPKFIFPPTALWHTALPQLSQTSPLPPITPEQLTSLTQKASALHQADVHAYQSSSSSSSSSSEAVFLSKIIQSGTLSDRLSALTLLVQSSPVHNAKALETLKGMSERGKGKGGREESLKALRCIVDWWVGGGVPDRKLKYFRDQPLTHPEVTDECLVLWYFEDWLKRYFFSILQVLELISLDPLPYIRIQSLTLIFTLLRDKPEQEQNLLRLLVNKLGDTEKSLSSRASYHLLNLLQAHPSMKNIVIQEIMSLVLRPPPTSVLKTPSSQQQPPAGKHVRFTDSESQPHKATPKPTEKKITTTNAHAKYYATITFNQIVLTPGERQVALTLIEVYFEMFKEVLGEDPHVDEGEGEGVDEDEDGKVLKDKKGRVVVRGNRKKKKTNEFKGAAGFTEVESTHSKLISAILTGVNRAIPFAKIDAGDVGLNKHINTLFLITHTSTFNISLQALVLIQQISASLSQHKLSSSSSSSSSKSIIDRYYRALYDSLHDTRLATSSKQAMYLNLLFKSIKADAGNGERVRAIVRRFVQVLVTGGNGATEFVAGGLYLLGELFSTIPGLRSSITDPAHQDLKNAEEAYDPRKRDPQYAHASSAPLWELAPLLHHYHPAISLHARQLLTSVPLTASADLSLNTLSHFLDRFVYKNPKKAKQEAGVGKAKGASAMQPAADRTGGGVTLLKGEVEDPTLMNEAVFLRKRVQDVPVDQVFFHKYFSRKSEREKGMATKVGKRKGQESDDEEESEASEVEAKKKPAGEEQEEEEEENSDEEEAEIWKAMKATMPKAEGDDDLLLEGDESDDDVPSNLDTDDDEEEESKADDEDAGAGDDSEGMSLVEGSDNEDLVSLDDEVPDGLIEWDGSDVGHEDDEEGWGGIEDNSSKKRKRGETSNKARKKKLRTLPTFASYEEYAKMIEDGPEDDI